MTYANGTLRSRSVVVTGASSGIGRGIALAMADEGARLALVGRDRGRLQGCAEEVRSRGAEAEVTAVDLVDESAPRDIVDGALAAFGSLDVLVHSAGIFEPIPFPDAPLESLDRQWALNVRAPFALTQAALPHLQRGSSVIFISSIAGHAGFISSAAYCATKGAVELLVRSLAIELAPRGVRVNAVAPGNIRTPMNEHQLVDPEYEALLVGRTPAGKIGDVEEVVPSVVFLASDGGRYIHGESLTVDGGWTA